MKMKIWISGSDGRIILNSIVFSMILSFQLLNGADFWTSTSGPNTSNINTILTTGDPNVYLGTNGHGVYKKGTTLFLPWIFVNTDLGNLYVNDLSIFNSYIFIINSNRTIIASTSDGVYTGNGGNWTSKTDMAGKNVRATVSKAYATFPPGIGGVTWLWSATDDGIYRSENGGTNWVQSGLDNESVVDLIFAGSDLFAAISGVHMYRSDDRGDSWEELNTNIFKGSYISSMASNADGDIFVTTSNIIMTAAGVYRSTDHGDTWTVVHGYSHPFFPNPGWKYFYLQYQSIAINSEGYIFVGTAGGSVYVSMNNGETWESKNEGLGEGTIRALAFDSDGYAYAAVDNSIYKSLEKSTELPELISKPGTPSGNTSVTAGENQDYTTSGATSNMGHTVEYRFNWGDGTYSNWSTSKSASKSWSAAGSYTVTVTARCQTHTTVSAVSDGLTVNAQVPPQVATPACSPAPGTYTAPPTVTLSCATSGALIYYTTNGSTPTESSTQYAGSITISSTTTLKARAYKSGYTASDIMTGIYEITGTVAEPSFDPAPGIYATPQTVTISCVTSGATIHFTEDGSDPDNSSTVIGSGGSIYISSTATLKAIAYKSGWLPSDIAAGTYTITGKVATPVFSPSEGTYTTPQNVTVSCATSGATIHFTTDGSDPDESDPAVSSGGEVYISGTTTLKAVACKSDWETSDIASATYTLNLGGNAVTTSEGVPDQFELFQNFPNPFNPVTVINFALPEDTEVTLQVFNLLGEKIVTLVDHKFYEAGIHTTMWNGRDQTGCRVQNGVYIYQLTAENYNCIKKASFLK